MEDQALTDSITKALAYQENGGKPNLSKLVAGKSGEMKSIFQFTPATWKAYSKDVFGEEKPLNNDNETYVVQQKVKKWIDEGKNTSQIASIWNAGNENAYKQNHVGTNKKYGVKYDTPKYAKNVLDYARKFYKEKSQQAPTSEQPEQSAPQNIQNKGVTGQPLALGNGTVARTGNSSGLIPSLAIPPPTI